MSLAPVIARIVIRYGVGALIAYGFVSREAGLDIIADPDLAILAGAVVGMVTEGWYAYAKRHGGPT